MQQMMKPRGGAQKLEFFKPKKTQLQKQHEKMTADQNQSSDQTQGLDEDQTGCICCCGAPGCRIGPFVPDEKRKRR